MGKEGLNLQIVYLKNIVEKEGEEGAMRREKREKVTLPSPARGGKRAEQSKEEEQENSYSI